MRLFLALCLSVSIVMTACNSIAAPLKVVPVSGKLMLKKSDGSLIPMKGAKIVLVPAQPAKGFQGYPSAKAGDDGTFKLGTYDKEDGAPEGEYLVTLEWKTMFVPKVDLMARGEIEKGPDKLKGVYSDSAKTSLRVTVKAGVDLDLSIPE